MCARCQLVCEYYYMYNRILKRSSGIQDGHLLVSTLEFIRRVALNITRKMCAFRCYFTRAGAPKFCTRTGPGMYI